MRQYAYSALTLILFSPVCLTAPPLQPSSHKDSAGNAGVAEQVNRVIPNILVKPPRLNASFTSGNKTLINRNQMTAAGVTNLAEALQNLGGVQLIDTTGNGSQVMMSMRGFGSNASSNTLLLINGIPITNPDLAPPNLNVIPVHDIETIEVIAGSESVLYGDQAVGGIININTRDHANEKFGLMCNAGSYNQHGCITQFYQQYQQILINAAISANHTDNYREHNNYDQQLLLGGIRYEYPLGQLKFNFNIAHENMLYPGALTAQQVHQNRRQASNNTDYFKNWNEFYHWRQQHYLNSLWSMLTDVAYRQMNGSGVLTSSFTQSRSSFFLKPQLTGSINNILIKTGVDWQIDNYELNSLYGTTDDKLQKYGLFAVSDFPLTRQLTLSIGARGAQQNNQLITTSTMNSINRAFASTLGLSYQLTANHQIYLRRAESFRFPKAEEDAFSSAANGLRTQRGAAYETGIEINQNQYNAKLGLYLLHLKDEITFDPLQTPQHPFGTNTNLDPTQRKGATLSAKYQLHTHVTLDGQYNFVNARFQSGINKNKHIPLVSENIIRAGMDWHFMQYWHMYYDAVFTGSQFAANDNANITNKLGGYTTYNFNLRYDYSLLSAALHINNIFNRHYYFYSVYQPGMQPDEFFYPAPDRNVTLTLNYSFN